MRPPWYFCCGWWSPWCLTDVWMHKLHMVNQWVCAKHDAVVDAYLQQRDGEQ